MAVVDVYISQIAIAVFGVKNFPGSRGDLAGQIGKHVADILTRFGTGLKEKQSVFAGIIGGKSFVNTVEGFTFCQILNQIHFVGSKCENDIWVSVPPQLIDPVFGFEKGFRLSYIICNDGRLCIPVINGGERVESLLASCVPYLQLYNTAGIFGKPAFLRQKGS